MLTRLQKFYLQSIGIDIWVRKDSDSIFAGKEEILNELDEKDKNIIFDAYVSYSKKENIRLLVIWDEPEPDQKEGNFSNDAYRLLEGILKAFKINEKAVCLIGLKKNEIIEAGKRNGLFNSKLIEFLGNIVKTTEARSILILGSFSFSLFVNSDNSFTDMRGKTIKYNESNIPIFVTYHPSFLLRKQSKKRLVWQDILRFKDHLKESE
tara:strand:+ start:52579 stop:53202 length:624 start_codon:yes stop_codon:yes gene_type:complete